MLSMPVPCGRLGLTSEQSVCIEATQRRGLAGMYPGLSYRKAPALTSLECLPDRRGWIFARTSFEKVLSPGHYRLNHLVPESRDIVYAEKCKSISVSPH